MPAAPGFPFLSSRTAPPPPRRHSRSYGMLRRPAHDKVFVFGICTAIAGYHRLPSSHVHHHLLRLLSSSTSSQLCLSRPSRPSSRRPPSPRHRPDEPRSVACCCLAKEKKGRAAYLIFMTGKIHCEISVARIPNLEGAVLATCDEQSAVGRPGALIDLVRQSAAAPVDSSRIPSEDRLTGATWPRRLLRNLPSLAFHSFYT